MSTGGDQTFGDEWIPPLDCLECGHNSRRTMVFCGTCRGPYYCIHCNGRIADVPPSPDPPPPDPIPLPPPDSPPIVDPPPATPTGDP